MRIFGKDIRCVIADIDGTLTDSQRLLPLRVKECIERLQRNGIYFVIASGRDYIQLLEDNLYWGFDKPFDAVIGMNGGQIYLAEDKSLYEYGKLSRDTVREIILMMEPLDLNPFVYGPDHTMICKRTDTETRASGERNDMRIHIVKDLSEFWERDLPKIMFRTPLSKVKEVEAYIAEHPSKAYRAFKTQTTMIEFQNPAVNKGNGLLTLAELMCMRPEEMIAFGDMTNDNEMLMAAGIGVCMKNGAEDTKAAADAVTSYTNDEDGFARFMERYAEGLKE